MLCILSKSSSLLDVDEELDDAEFTCRVIVTEAFFAVGIFKCKLVDWSESPPIFLFLERVKGPPFLVEGTQINEAEFPMSIIVFSVAFREIRMFSKRCWSFEDASHNGDNFDEEVKSTGEQDGGRAVIPFDPPISIPIDGGVLRSISVVTLLETLVGLLPLFILLFKCGKSGLC